MSRSYRLLPIAGATALSLALAACSSGPKVAATPPAIAATADEIEAIAQLLDRGEITDARKRLDSALRSDPMNPSLLVLHQSVVGDATADLGPTSYPYTVDAGDTMARLAERLLGNRLKSYQLARYNGIDNPATLAPGQVLRIPGQPARAGSDRAGQPGPSSRLNSTAVVDPTPKPRPAPVPSATPTARVADAAAARRARTAGLAALNNGDVADAVALLQRAAALDPGNDAIERDLTRARRIAATVRSQR